MSFFKIKKVSFLAVIFIGLGIMTWCMPPSTATAGEKPVKIGLLSPFSPPGDAASGQRMKWGAELAIKYINEEMGGVLGGRPVKLIVEDDAGTPADGIAGYRKLVQKDGVVGVVGQYHSSVCIAVNKVARDLKVPLFSSGASSPKITESENPFIFSIMSLTPDRSKFWVDFIKNMGGKRIAIAAEDTDYGTGFTTWVAKYAKEAGMEVKSIIFPRTITDLTPLLLEIKAWKPDFLVNIGVPPAAYLLTKQAYDIGLFPKVHMIASFAWPARDEFWNAVGDKGKGILYNSYYKPGMNMTDLGEWMSPRYIKLHDEVPTFFSLNVFGEIIVIAQAINMAQSDDPQKIAKALVQWPYKDWNGIVDFKEPHGVKWHSVSAPNIILQQTEVRQKFTDSKLIWPIELGGDGKIE
ncbi:MAG: ABC transporter substrate-binding protein [Deltaproteobacteria bacterium]|jgi:branched-chain amino acid transport system substrate-binding protein|nr:ABC transporter substrate-binding protein [Deltaproteobacteria bacterium]